MLYDQIKSAFERFAASWKTNDGAAVGGAFAEDGSLINPFGERADGRSAVAGMYSAYFQAMLGGTTTSFQLHRVRAVAVSGGSPAAWSVAIERLPTISASRAGAWFGGMRAAY